MSPIKTLLVLAAVLVVVGLCAAPASAMNVTKRAKYLHLNSTLSARPPTFVWGDEADEKLGQVVCMIAVNRTSNVTGWDHVQIAPTQSLFVGHAYMAHYASGFAEGYQTFELITYSRENILKEIKNIYNNGTLRGSIDESTTNVKEWVDRHIENIRLEAMLGDKGQGTKQQQTLLLLVSQMEGMVAGFNKYIEDNKLVDEKMSFTDVFLLNFLDEIYDVYTATRTDSSFMMAQQFQNLDAMADRRGRRANSAYVRVTSEDVYFAHATWTDYSRMLRHYKTYVFETTLVFTGYPGMISSHDDWYMSSSGLAVMQTGFDIFATNLTRDELHNKTNTVSTFLRCMIANLLSTTAAEWADNFVYGNSGTANAQWIIMDMNKYTRGEATLPAGALWIVEQLPMDMYKMDQTAFVNQNGYWAGYGLPAIDETYNISGTLEMRNNYGAFFSRNGSNRAVMFQQMTAAQGNTTTIGAVRDLIRHNNYLVDQTSKILNCSGGVCSPAASPALAVASRQDLQLTAVSGPPSVFKGYFDSQAFGAIDAKVTTFSLMHATDSSSMFLRSDVRAMLGDSSADKEMKAEVQCGPSTGTNLAAFDWSKSTYAGSVSHAGQFGGAFSFPFKQFDTKFAPYVTPEPSKKSSKWVWIVIGICAGVVLIAIVVIVVVKVFLLKPAKEVDTTADEGSPLV